MRFIAHKCGGDNKRRHAMYKNQNTTNETIYIVCRCTDKEEDTGTDSCFVFDHELVKKCKYHK